MNKTFALLSILILGAGLALSSNALELNPSVSDHRIKLNTQDKAAVDTFTDDPFFQFDDDVLKEMSRMHQAMQKLINSQFSKMKNSLSNGYSDINLINQQKNQIKKEKDKLIYTIKLPKGTENKVRVTAKNGRIFIVSSMTKEVTREQDNSKSISYSHSSNTQSLQIPSGYSEKSMETHIAGTNLTITLKKNT